MTRALETGIWSGLSGEQRDLIRETEAEEAEAEQKPIEDDLAEAISVIFGVTAEEVRQALEDGDFALLGEEKPGELLRAERVFDKEQLKRRIRQALQGQSVDGTELSPQGIEAAAEKGAEVASKQMNASGAFNPGNPAVQEATEALNEQAKGISETTRKRINRKIRQAQSDPDKTVQDAADKIVEDLRKQAGGDQNVGPRARRIAATTVNTGFEAGQMSAMRKVGAEGRTWISHRDDRVRPGHLEADSEGQARRLEEPFNVSPERGLPQEQREELMYPSDPSGSPSNVIFCRCTQAPILTEEGLEEAQATEPDLGNLPQLAEDDA
jgi:uncharacterized protein with gpF-like domain